MEQFTYVSKEEVRPNGTSCAQQHGLLRQCTREGSKTPRACPDTHPADITIENGGITTKITIRPERLTLGGGSMPKVPKQ